LPDLSASLSSSVTRTLRVPKSTPATMGTSLYASG
jgi:hypothetical protein